MNFRFLHISLFYFVDQMNRLFKTIIFMLNCVTITCKYVSHYCLGFDSILLNMRIGHFQRLKPSEKGMCHGRIVYVRTNGNLSFCFHLLHLRYTDIDPLL